MKPNQNQLQNGLFQGLQGEQKQQFQRLVADTRINMCSTLLIKQWREVVPVAESLVAWDTRRDTIVKFISSFIPAMPGVDKGSWFKIHKDGEPAAPIPIEADATLCPAWLEMAKMPAMSTGLEFRLLRAFRHDVNVPARFQILNFTHPTKPITMVDRRTIVVEHEFNTSPVFDINKMWWHEQILKKLSRFSGVPLSPQTDVKAEIQRQAAAGAISAGVAEELIHANDDAFEPGLPVRVGQEALAAMQDAAAPQPHSDPLHNKDGETFSPSDLDKVGQEALAHMQVAGSHIESVEKTISNATEEAISEIGFEAEDEIPHNPLAEGYVKPEDEPVEDDIEVALPQ